MDVWEASNSYWYDLRIKPVIYLGNYAVTGLAKYRNITKKAGSFFPETLYNGIKVRKLWLNIAFCLSFFVCRGTSGYQILSTFMVLK